MALQKLEVDFCLLIPCFNNEAGLLHSLRSVHYNSNRFLIVLVDDGSDNPLTETVWKGKIDIDCSIRLLTMPQNQGITAALNYGLQWIYDHVRTNYVARLDCGDTCHADRFIEQVNWMDAHPDYLLLGCWCRFEDVAGEGYDYITATDYQQIKRGMHFRNLFIHPGMLFRITDPAGEKIFYSHHYPHAEDFALAWMLIRKGPVAILPKILVRCELNTTGLSASNRSKQLISRKNVIKDNAVNNILKYGGILYHYLLRLAPKELVLRLKKQKF